MNVQRTLVSVIVPVYKVEDYLDSVFPVEYVIMELSTPHF